MEGLQGLAVGLTRGGQGDAIDGEDGGRAHVLWEGQGCSEGLKELLGVCWGD